MEDNPDAPSGHEADNVIPFERGQRFRTAHPSYSGSHDDDELLKGANDKIAEWQATSNLPSLTQVQELFYGVNLLALALARDKIVSAIIAAFGDQRRKARWRAPGVNSQGSGRRAVTIRARQTGQRNTRPADPCRETGAARRTGPTSVTSRRLRPDRSSRKTGAGYGRRQ
jgi:hypothetical protein